MVHREDCSKGAAQVTLHTQTAQEEMELPLPAVNEIWYRVMLAERGCVKVHANLHIVAGHDAHGCLVFVLKNLSL